MAKLYAYFMGNILCDKLLVLVCQAPGGASLCIAEIVLPVRISSWNFVRVPKATKFQFEILTMNVISGIVYFCEIILEGLWNVGKTPPVVWS